MALQGGDVLKVGFKVKYGYNEIEIPITEETKPKYRPLGRNNKYTQQVTIYNDIPADGVNPRSFDRFVIEKCLIYGGFTEGADGTIQTIVNSQNVITKDVEHYKSPLEYRQLPVDEKEKYYTVQVDDFIVLAEVDDVVTTSREFQDLQSKYKNNGFSVTAVNEYIHGMAVDNVQIIHA